MKTLLVCLAFLMEASAWAEPSRSVHDTRESARREGTVLFVPEADVGFHSFEYEEDPGRPGFESKESGVIPEFGFGAQVRATSGAWFARSRVSLATADTLHRGSDMKGGSHVEFQNPNSFLNLEALGGVRLVRVERFFGRRPLEIDAYAGLGYRRWSRGDGRVVQRLANYNETYTWMYLPVGVLAEATLSERWSAGLDISVRPTFAGGMTAYFSQSEARQDDVHTNLGSTVGWRIAVPVSWTLVTRPSVVAAFTPFFEYSSIGESDPVAVTRLGKPTGRAVREPDSHTSQFGTALTASVAL